MTTPGNPAHTKADVPLLIAEYVCGLLTPGERAQVHELLARDDAALAQALAWEERLLALVDALPRLQPAPALRERLQKTLGIQPPPALQPPPQPILLQKESVDGPLTALAASTMAAAPASVGTMQHTSSRQEPRRAWAPRPVRNTRPAGAGTTSSVKPAGRRASASAPTPTGEKTAETAPGPRKLQNGDTGRASSRSGEAEGDAKPHDTDAAARKALVRKLWFWRLIGLCATGAALAGFLIPAEPPPPPVQVIKVAPTRAAVLQAPGTSSTPGWTATLDPQGNLMMRPLVRTELPAGTKALLWTRSARVPEPRLLGHIDPNRPVQVAAARLGPLADDQILEITQETEEDAAKGLANGPILFIGQMTVFGSDTPTLAGAASQAGGGRQGDPGQGRILGMDGTSEAGASSQ